MMQAFFQRMTDHIQRICYLTLAAEDRLGAPVEEHAAVLLALAKRDAATARRAVEGHLAAVVAVFEKPLWGVNGDSHDAARYSRTLVAIDALGGPKVARHAPRSIQRRARPT
jgi:hypothetical protein